MFRQPTFPPSPAVAAGTSALEAAARPLLRLVQHVTGMESSFVTEIDWDAQQQDVLYSLNTGEMQIPEGSTTAWNDSMCRSMFLAGRAASNDLGAEVEATCNAVNTGMESFVAVPILDGDQPIGTVCGASHSPIKLSDEQVDALQWIADALQQLMLAHLEVNLALARAKLAEDEARTARNTSVQQAIDYEQMAKMAHTDELTGLPNRRAFVSRWEDAMARSGRRHFDIGVMLIDADRFKAVNDNDGHQAGDEVLAGIGAALRQTAHREDLIARLGGDEFAMAITHASRDDFVAKAGAIRKAFADIGAQLGVTTTLSIGIAHSDDSPRQQLLANADAALYRSKWAGGDCATLFNRDLLTT